MRLGDLDALKEKMWRSDVSTREKISNIIDNAPTIIWCSKTPDGLPLIDLRPRPQGEWIEKQETPSSISYYCSNCEHIGLGFENFCAWCGADMRGGDENETDN